MVLHSPHRSSLLANRSSMTTYMCTLVKKKMRIKLENISHKNVSTMQIVGCGMTQIGCGVDQLGCGVAQIRVRRDSN